MRTKTTPELSKSAKRYTGRYKKHQAITKLIEWLEGKSNSKIISRTEQETATLIIFKSNKKEIILELIENEYIKDEINTNGILITFV